MKIAETLIRELIRESLKRDLLTEARFALKNLLIFKETVIDEVGTNLFDAVNESFIKNGGTQHDLNNPKSAGRFFIDVLFECMEELNEEITDNPTAVDIPDWLETLTNYILFLFSQKEVTSRSVLSGETFKEYILNFMNNYSKLRFPGTVTIYDRLQYVYQRLNEKAVIGNIENILSNKEIIKSEKETFYPFGNQIKSGYLIVAPKTTRSSIFWARTNWLGEGLTLPNQDDIGWCTARYKGGNMFNSYYSSGGTTLFYFLPEGDVTGTGKFCVGIGKRKYVLPKFRDEMREEYHRNKKNNPVLNNNEDEGEDYKIYEYEHSQKFPKKWGYKLEVGGYTTVNFENKPLFENEKFSNSLNDLNSKSVQKELNRLLNISDPSVLLDIIKTMETRDAADPEKYVAMFDVEQFAAATNIDNLAPIDPETGERDYAMLWQCGKQMSDVVKMYNSKLYKAKGYVPDEKILNYIDKNYLYYIKEGVMSLPFLIPKNFQSPEGLSKFLDLLIDFLLARFENKSSLQQTASMFDTEISWNMFKDVDVFKKPNYNVLFNILNSLEISGSQALAAKAILVFYLAKYKKPIDFAKRYYDLSSVSGILNYVENFEKELSRHDNLPNLDSLNEYFKSKILYQSGTPEAILSLLINCKDELLSMSDEELMDLFYKYKIPLFFQLVSKEYLLNNPRVALEVAAFVKSSKLYEPIKSASNMIRSGSNFELLICIFIKNFRFNDEGYSENKSTNLPEELLNNKKFIMNLIQIDPAHKVLLNTFDLPFKNDADVVTISIKDGNDGAICQTVKSLLGDVSDPDNIIAADLLNSLIQTNVSSFHEITRAVGWFLFSKDGYNENVKNIFGFINNFLRNESNVIKILSSETINAVYAGKIDLSNFNNENYRAYGFSFELLISTLNFIEKSCAKYFKRNQDNDWLQPLADDFKKLFYNIMSFEFVKNVANLMKNQYFNNLNNNVIKSVCESEFKYLITNIRSHAIKKKIAGSLGGNIISDEILKQIIKDEEQNKKDALHLEQKSFKQHANKLILTERQLRDFIVRSLRA